MEDVPFRQAMGMGEGLLATPEVRDMRGGEIHIHPYVAIPTAPHVEFQRPRLFELHRPSNWGGETEAAARRLIQPNEKLQRPVSNVAFHQGRSVRWRRDQSATPSSLAPCTTTTS